MNNHPKAILIKFLWPSQKTSNLYGLEMWKKIKSNLGMWFVIKTFELLGWVKTNPKSLKVFSSLGILSSFSIPSNFVEFFEDNFRDIMDNF